MPLANFEGAIHFFLSHPGTREVRDTYRVGFPIVADIIDRTLEERRDGESLG